MSTIARSSAVYVYGLVRANLDLELGPIGIHEDGAPAPVYTLPVGRIAAVVSNPELAYLRDRLFTSTDPSGLAEQIELGQRFEACLQAKRAQVVNSLVDGLAVNLVPPKELPVRSEKAVADLMFLIERSDRARFEEDVRQLAAAWPPEYAFRVTGPWAPFNFVELQLSGSTRSYQS